MSKWWRLFERTTPGFGQFTVWALCGFAVVLAVYPFSPESGDRQSMATIFGWMPVTILESQTLFSVTRVWLLGSAIAWAGRILMPWSCWSTALSFTVMWSLRMENTSHAAHIFNATNMLIIIHALWHHVERKEIRTALNDGTYCKANVYPNWVFALSVFYLCWFHTWAGMTKLQTTGITWGNGLSLQLWVNMWGWPSSPSTQLILSSRTFTRVLQSGALLFETTAIVGILGKYCRWWVGATLLSFYFGVLTTFVDYGFHMNAFLVGWFLLPVYEWIQRKPTAATPQ